MSVPSLIILTQFRIRAKNKILTKNNFTIANRHNNIVNKYLSLYIRFRL